MEFTCFKHWSQLPKSADELFSIYEQESLFFSRPWFENLVNTALQPDQSMLLACVIDHDNDQNHVLAILPLMVDAQHNCSILSHRYTSVYTLLLATTHQDSVLTCLIHGLSTLQFHSLRFEPMAEHDPQLQLLQQAMEVNGFSCHRHFKFYNWFHQTNGQTFSDYMAERPGRLRNTIARKGRKLEREHGYEIRLYIDDDIQQGLDDYKAIYHSSWKANELFGSIIDGLVKHLSQQGWLRLAVLYTNKQPAAAQLWFVVHKKASIFRLAYDEAWKQYSPGSLLTHYLMEYVMDTDKVEEIDFLMGNEAYKQDWMTERRERWSLVCAQNNPAQSKMNRIFRIIQEKFFSRKL
jgi:hypothetical protein